MMRKAWIVWTPAHLDGTLDHCGVVVYASSRGKARWMGASEMGTDDVLDLRVVRAPKADHLAETRERPDAALLESLGFLPGYPDA